MCAVENKQDNYHHRTKSGQGNSKKYNTMEAVVMHEGQEVDVDGNSNFWVIAVEGGSRLATSATSKKRLPKRARKPAANP